MSDYESHEGLLELTNQDIQQAMELCDAWKNNKRSWMARAGLARYLLPKMLNQILTLESSIRLTQEKIRLAEEKAIKKEREKISDFLLKQAAECDATVFLPEESHDLMYLWKVAAIEMRIHAKDIKKGTYESVQEKA